MTRDAPAPDAILLATLEGFRDFHPRRSRRRISTHARFAHSRILTGEFARPSSPSSAAIPTSFAPPTSPACSTNGPGQQDLLADLAREISRMVQGCGVPGCRHIVLPACLSLGLVGPRLSELERRNRLHASGGCHHAAVPHRHAGCRRPQSAASWPFGGTFLTSERVLGAR